VNNYSIFIWIAVAGVVFAILWRKGYLLRLSNYVRETREELRKCTWPTWAELKGSTAVVMISILLLGGFTVLADAVFAIFVNWLGSIT
jgi:preprotein translocase subunit SecE